jgi:hypothetical protein
MKKVPSCSQIKLPAKDLEVIFNFITAVILHKKYSVNLADTYIYRWSILSVSLNKIGDLRYYEGDLQFARSYYARSLDVRRCAVKEHLAVASQVISMLPVMIYYKSK